MGQWSTPALSFAAHNGHVGIVQALLAMPGIDVNAKNQLNDTALICAARQEHVAVVRALLAMPGINVNASNQANSTALMLAAANGHVAIVEALLVMPCISIDPGSIRRAIDASRASSPEQRQRMRHALSRHQNPPTFPDTQVLFKLLSRIFRTHASIGGATASATSAASSTAQISDADADLLNDMCTRLQFGKCTTAEVPALLVSIDHLPQLRKETVVLALAFGFSLGHFHNAQGVLDDAIADALRHSGMFKAWEQASGLLLKAKERINLYRDDEMNLLRVAAKAGNLLMIRGLVQLGAHVNLPSPNGDTALAAAVRHGQWACCVELISLGALPTLPGVDGYPMIYHLVRAVSEDRSQTPALIGVIRYLMYRGVRFDIPVRNPDESKRAETPTVLLSDLLCSDVELWLIYWRLLYGLPDEAPAAAAPAGAVNGISNSSATPGDMPIFATTTAPQINLPRSTPNAAPPHAVADADAMQGAAATAPDTSSADGISAMLAPGMPLASFIAWLDRDARHLDWRDAQTGQGLLHLAVAGSNVGAVQLLLARGAERRLVDRAGRTPAQLLPANHLSSFTETMVSIAELLEK
jgi:ankyrin repeat protein